MKKLICKNLGINEKGHLTFAGFDTVELASKYGTPVYLLDEDLIRERCRTYVTAMKKHFSDNAMPLFASKALSFGYIYKIMKEEGMGIDLVSSGELYTAIKAGYPLENAYFHGNNKTDEDIAFALDNGVGYFIVDNNDELNALDAAAAKRGIRQKILLRITPGIDPHTFKAVVTGNVDSKFGSAIITNQALEITKKALLMNNIVLEGFHCHIGSQIFEAETFIEAAEIMLSFVYQVRQSLGFVTKVLNIGGGFGVRYLPEQTSINIDSYIEQIANFVKKYCADKGVLLPRILMEPGRSTVADSGMTLYTVGSVKHITGYKSYAAIDGGMTDNPRYALYQSPYTIIAANKANTTEDSVYTIAGRCCESGDLIQEDVSLPSLVRGDILAVLTTGAYNYAMSSNYNRLPRPPVVMLSGGKDRVVVKREDFEDIIRNDIF